MRHGSNEKKPTPIIVQAARAWTLASLRAKHRGTRLEQAAQDRALRIAHNRLIAAARIDDSPIGQLLFHPRNYDRWPQIFFGVKPNP